VIENFIRLTMARGDAGDLGITNDFYSSAAEASGGDTGGSSSSGGDAGGEKAGSFDDPAET
jgi:hypothetical protein